MLTDSKNLLSQQWLSLHNDHEQYERYALLIKLFAIVITLTSFVFSMPPLITTVLLVITWLLEGVWKTFQTRTASAIITIEKKLIENEVIEEGKKPVTYYSMYSQWQANRRDLNTLFREYITSSLKPTVLFPYLLLLMLAIVL
jgi:hypothetical protein